VDDLPSTVLERDNIKRRAWVMLVGLPLIAVAGGIVLAAALSYDAALVLVPFGLLVSSVNYRQLKRNGRRRRPTAS